MAPDPASPSAGVFLDTGYLVALEDADDDNHAAAREHRECRGTATSARWTFTGLGRWLHDRHMALPHGGRLTMDVVPGGVVVIVERI